MKAPLNPPNSFEHARKTTWAEDTGDLFQPAGTTNSLRQQKEHAIVLDRLKAKGGEWAKNVPVRLVVELSELGAGKMVVIGSPPMALV